MQIRMDEKGRILFMATYVISVFMVSMRDLMELLEEIELKIQIRSMGSGDVLDRGEASD